MAAQSCTAVAVPAVSGVWNEGKGFVTVFRRRKPRYLRAHGEAAWMPSVFARLKVIVTLRNMKVRAERDPFADFSAAFVEDVEEDEEEGSGGTANAEREAIIAFETGAVGEDEDVESTDEDPWEDKSAKDPRVDLPKPKQGKGVVISHIFTVFLGLLERPFGSDGRMIAAAGGAVTERIEEEVEKLRGLEGVDEQILFEILRVVRLIEMDLQLVSAARKDQTLMERLMQTAVHTKQALDIANYL